MSLERLLLHYRDQIKNEMGKTCSTYGEEGGAYSILVGNPDGKRHLGRPGCKLEGNIKMDLQEVGLKGVDLIDLAQYRGRWQD